MNTVIYSKVRFNVVQITANPLDFSASVNLFAISVDTVSA